MAYRKIPYGYIIRNGELAIAPREAVTVKRIFTAYLEGYSYQGIAEMLNEDKIAYCSENQEWNKHKVKRLLEKSRYIGEKGYPAIIATEMFEQIQAIIQSKLPTGSLKQNRPAVKLVEKLYCGECDTKLQRLGFNKAKPGVIYLKCPNCGKLINLADERLLLEVEQQRMLQKNSMTKAKQSYVQKVELMRIENELNRVLEKLDEPIKAIHLIQQGITNRYVCCESQTEPNNLKILRIDVNGEKITAYFK